jgi:orotate phosphoribosyltransferase/AMMECR1 domain-containing protein
LTVGPLSWSPFPDWPVEKQTMTVSDTHWQQGADSLRLSEEISPDRDKLLRFLQSDGFLNAGVEQPIKGRDGRRVPWMFYSWNCSLTGPGALLAGRCLLDLLQSFRATQLASFGYTGIPLLTACILSGEGKYTGLVIREIRKQYGSSRQIEGPADKSRPVVVIDDSLSSGTSLKGAIRALEEEGFQVEGAVVLVNFPYRGGREWASALGYRVEAVFDAWQDLAIANPPFVPGHMRFSSEIWADNAVPDGMHPAVAARRVAEFYLSYGLMLRPPARFDEQYDGSGGVFVSFRERDTDHRLARDGFWHFNPDDSDPCRDLILAAVKTVRSSARSVNLDNLADLKIAATFFGPLEKIPPAKLDFPRYGIVVRSTGWATKMGGALPNSQIYTSEIEQYTHARWRNAKIPYSEPHDLFRHEITKRVEPGEYWLPYGTYQRPDNHWTNDESLGRSLTDRALAALRAKVNCTRLAGDPLPDGLIPAPVYAIAVTLYHQGVVGCFITWGGSLDSCLIRAANSALTDARFVELRGHTSIEDLGISVSILHDREWLGETTLEKAATKLRLGADSMSVQQGTHRGFLLSTVVPHFNWNKEKFAKELLRKAKIAGPPYTWSTYQTATWLRTTQGVHKIISGFTKRTLPSGAEKSWESDVRLMASYIVRNIAQDGLPEYLYLPVTGERQRGGSPARRIHALAALENAAILFEMPAWRDIVRRGLEHCLDRVVSRNGKASLCLQGQPPSAMTDCQLLAAAADSHFPVQATDIVAALAARVQAMFQPDGRMTDTPRGLGVASEHDFLPGAALLAMAKYAHNRGESFWLDNLSPQLNWYRRRFRQLHPWGMVGWQTRAWSAVHNVIPDPEYAQFVFEMADWALDWQHERTGAFITELSPSGPGFHTAFLAEGIAAAWELAIRIGDEKRADRYAHSCSEALRFMTELIIFPEDTFCMRDPSRAVGGVRGSLITSSVRIDFVSHTLLAFAVSVRLMRAGIGMATL